MAIDTPADQNRFLKYQNVERTLLQVHPGTHPDFLGNELVTEWAKVVLSKLLQMLLTQCHQLLTSRSQVIRYFSHPLEWLAAGHQFPIAVPILSLTTSSCDQRGLVLNGLPRLKGHHRRPGTGARHRDTSRLDNKTPIRRLNRMNIK